MILERETPENVGYFKSSRFMSASLGNSFPIGHPVVGYRFDRIEVMITTEDYFKKDTQRWLSLLFTRIANMNKYNVKITVLP